MPKQGDPILRDALVGAGLPVVEIDGWRDRGRTWDDQFAPKYILTHHTASLATTKADITYILMGRDTAPGPISQLYVSRGTDPAWYVLAAGGANHAGAGTWPDGSTGNKFAWGVEAANTGGYWIPESRKSYWEQRAASVGAQITFTPTPNNSGQPGYRMDERWADEMVECYAKGVMALLRAFGWSTDQVLTHAGYAPGRKVDPSGLAKFWPSITTWDIATWRAFINSFNVTPPPPEPVHPTNPTGPTYVVQPGDSWWRISVQVYGVGRRWQDIANMNGGAERVLRPGDVLLLPSDGVVPAPVTPPQPPPPPNPVAPPPSLSPQAATAAMEAKLVPVKPGEQGIHVKRVQGILAALGFNPGAIDGYYGASASSPTRKAIMDFQRSVAVTQDGVVGTKQTWPALLGTSGNTALVTVKPGSSGRPVKVVQGLLLANGCDPGALDGKYGASASSPTRKAVVDFQERVDIAADGVVGLDQTWPFLLGTH